jgi:hypothetical protein
MSNNTVSNLALAAAFAGLLGGTTARLNAQPTPGHSEATASSAPLGLLVAAIVKVRAAVTRSTPARTLAKVRALAPLMVQSHPRASFSPCRGPDLH